jgi:hypothetical protein
LFVWRFSMGISAITEFHSFIYLECVARSLLRVTVL